MQDQSPSSIYESVNQDWFSYLSANQQSLLRVSLALLEQQDKLTALEDYSFIVFPASKAYEGFLKKILLDHALISYETYAGRRLRIGRALNPDVKITQRDKYWFYDDLIRIYGPELSKQIWQVWLECRNHIFHFFPGKEEIISLENARHCLEQLIDTMSTIVENSQQLRRIQADYAKTNLVLGKEN